VARVIGGVTVVGALLAASLLPHLPPTYFADGLARSPEGRSLDGTGGSVSFTETMDLRQDLSSQSDAPVLRYRTSSSFLEPLRVTATSVFEDGEWLPPEYAERPVREGVGRFDGGPVEGIGEDIIISSAEISVTQNAMRAPFLAVPSNVLSADLGVPWQVDGRTSALRVEDPPEQYQAVFLQVAPRGQLPEDVGSNPVEGLPRQQELLRVDPEAEEAIANLAAEVVGDAENDLQVANLIQNHLRNTTYVYNLELAPGGGDTDPITHFLQTQQGYCVQFATAMVMMARHEGIPARMAVGFLSGELQADGTREVLASDAHTWPELYIDGLGWTRFEPTPGARTGVAPAYTQLETGTPQEDPTAGVEETAPTPTLPTEAAGDTEDQGWWGSLLNLAPGLGRALVVLLVLGLLMALVPWAGRRYREAGIRAAQDDPGRIEGQWLFLQRSLGDLGVDQPPPRSPREMQAHYLEQTKLDRRSNEALGRVTATLERSRYAPASEDPTQVDRMGRDVRAVVGAVQEKLPWNIRVNARLLPRSGLLALRERLAGLVRRSDRGARR
jgi:transglutaminase-like putative cysteine protease